METFAEMKALFDVDIYSIIDEAFKDPNIQDAVIKLNQEQLQSGNDALGQTIVTIGGSPYRASTVKIRRKRGLQTNNVDLKFTGEFYQTFKVIGVTDGYEITADFEKDDGSILDNFLSKYDFLGLDDESLAELVFEQLLNFIYNALAKRFNL